MTTRSQNLAGRPFDVCRLGFDQFCLYRYWDQSSSNTWEFNWALRLNQVVGPHALLNLTNPPAQVGKLLQIPRQVGSRLHELKSRCFFFNSLLTNMCKTFSSLCLTSNFSNKSIMKVWYQLRFNILFLYPIILVFLISRSLLFKFRVFFKHNMSGFLCINKI